MRIVVLSLLIVFQLSTVIQAQDVPTLVYAESRLPYREHGDQIMPPTPSGEDKAETSEEKRLLNLLYATVICYSRFLGRGDNVPTASLCDVKIRQSLHGEKIYIELRLKPDIYWRQPITDPKNRIINQDLLYTIDYLRNWKSSKRERVLGAFFSDNVEIDTAGYNQDLLLIRMNSSMQGPHFPKMDEWSARFFFSTFHIIPTPRLKDPQGGGPYIFQSLNRARKEIILKKNPLAFHWRDADPQAPAKIVIKELSDRLPKLISGEVDLVPEIGATALFRTELQNEFQILYSPASSFYYIGFNNNEDSQTMQRLLRGMAKTTGGLDWFAILKRAYEGIDQETKHFIRNNNFNKDAEVLTGPFDSSSPVELAYDEASEQAEEQWTQTIKTQQELVAGNCLQSASGNKGLLADPIVLKTLGMKKWTIIYQDFSKFSPELKDIADGFAARLQQLGATPNQIEVNGVRSLNQWQYKIHNRLFDCVVAHFDYGQDYDIADFIMPQGTQNYVGFYSRQVVRHFEEFQKTQDPGRRVFCLTQIHKLLREQFPGIFVIAPVKFTVYNQRKIRRLYTDDNFFFARMQHWQMHTEKKQP